MDKFNVIRKDEKEIVFLDENDMIQAYSLSQDNKQFVISYVRDNKKCSEIINLEIIKGIIEGKISLKTEKGE